MCRIFNQKGVDPEELITKDAAELAKKVTTRKDENTKSQMRRFYQEFVKIRSGIPRGDNDAYERNKIPLKMLIAKVAYASGRKNSNIATEFRQWLEKNLKAISNADDVHTFGDYYEAFIGFFYAEQAKK